MEHRLEPIKIFYLPVVEKQKSLAHRYTFEPLIDIIALGFMHELLFIILNLEKPSTCNLHQSKGI